MQNATFKLSAPWQNVASAPQIDLTVSSENGDLIFSFSGVDELNYVRTDENCQFFEGLWKMDCLEVFLASRNGRYLEINAVPNGSWWGCWFNAPRIRSTRRLPDLRFHFRRNKATSAAWNLTVTICNAAHIAPLDELRWNATAIVNSPDQVFLSAAPLDCESPDFHQPHAFLPLPKHR